MKLLFNSIETQMNKISQDLFKTNYEDLTFKQTRKVHNKYFTN